MPKKPTGLSSQGKSKKSPISNTTFPGKQPAMGSPKLPNPMPNRIAPQAMPGARFAKISKPAPLKPRTPRI